MSAATRFKPNEGDWFCPDAKCVNGLMSMMVFIVKLVYLHYINIYIIDFSRKHVTQ